MKASPTRRAPAAPKDAGNSSSAKPLSSTRQRHILEEALAIEQDEAAGAGALGFMASVLVQVTLPHVDPCVWTDSGIAEPGSVFFTRESGKVRLQIRGMPQYGLPFGSIPRLLLAWMCTEAIRTDSQVLSLGTSAAEFARKLNLGTGGRDLGRLKRQCIALARTVISLDGISRADGAFEFEDIKIASRGLMFWNDKTPHQSTLWQSSIELTGEFFRAVKERPVPFRMRAYHALSKSPLAMDIYTWLPYRMFILSRSGRSRVDIPWEGLQGQFGTTSAKSEEALRRFKSNFIARMKEALVFYPEATPYIATDPRYLTLRPAPLHVNPRRIAQLAPQSS